MNTDIQFGKGAYTLKELALFARLNPQTAHRWFLGAEAGRAVIPEGEKVRFFSFLDFVQALAVRELRVKHDVSLPKIREALDYAKSAFGMAYPLAQRSSMFLCGGKLLIQPPDRDNPVQATGKAKGQHEFRKILAPYLTAVSFDPESGYAATYLAYTHKNENIVFDPSVQFGQPVVQGTSLTAARLAAAIEEEGGVEAAAEAMGVTTDQVTAAWQYVDTLRAA
jgi:uncharacterized protein (DUF433 family)